MMMLNKLMNCNQDDEDDPNKKLTITSLKAAVKHDRIEQIENSLRQYGLPRSGTKTTDYLILQIAIRNRKTEISKLLIDAGCHVNKNRNEDNNDYTPLALAIQTENEEIATLLLKKRATWDAGNNSGYTVLHLAAKDRSVKMINFLLHHQIYINHISNGKTPFQVFLESTDNIYENKSIDVIRILLTKGASINFKTSNGQTVLHYMVKTKQNDIIKAILQATVNVNEQDNIKNTALHSLLNESNCNEENIENIIDVVKCFISKGVKVNIQNKYGDTVLHIAAKKKYLQILQIFLQCQWDVNCRNQEGNTVLHCILMGSADLHNSAQYLEIVNHILKQDSLQLVKNSQGKTPLHIAADNKQSQILNDMLSKPVDINATDERNNTVFYIFMKNLADQKIVPDKDVIEIVKKMISLGADPAYYSMSQNSPMHFALQLRNKEIILLLLGCGFNFHAFENAQKKSLLHFLIGDKLDSTEIEELHMTEIAEMCIKQGATIDSRDVNSKTPLYLAVLMRQKHMVRTLLEYGADPNLLDSEGGTILENLMKKEFNDQIRHHSPNIYYHTTNKKIPQNIERDSEIAQMLLLKKAVAERVSNGHVSIFHYCAVKSHLGMLREIIPYSKDPNIRDSEENTILHALLTYNLNSNEEVEKKVAEIVAILLSKGGNVTAVNEKGETPLHLAAKGKHLVSSKLLLQQDASIADLDSNGNSVLHFLCMLQLKTDDLVQKRLIELFVSKGSDVNAKNNCGMTPFLFAAQSGSINMLRILKNLNAKIDCSENENLSTAIHFAAENNYQEIIEQLIEYGVDVNVRRRDRKTALHLSVAHNLPKVTRLLLESGADSDLKDSDSKTPLHWACWYEWFDNINELLDYGADINVEDNFQATPLMLTSQSINSIIKLRYHTVKLGTANMPVSNRNKSHIEKYDKEYRNYTNSAEMKEFKSAAVEETLKMEKVPIAPRTSLADVLLMSANKLSVFKCNEDFQKLLYSDDFKEKFPIYADLVKACYRKGIIRSDLMISAKDAFRNMLGFTLPDTCCDSIFYYLDNENLHNLDKAAKIRITKRERFLDKINEGNQAKRVRRT